MAYDEIDAVRVRDILSGRRDVVETRLMGGLCFMVAGNMACSVSARGGLLIRVGPDGVAPALKHPHVSQMRMGTRAMSGFVRIEPEGYRTEAALKKWIARGVDFALTLPRKKAKR
jgi:TfoX N-terminal domain